MSGDVPLPFSRRFGSAGKALIFDNFPETARVGLLHILDALIDKGCLVREPLLREVERIARFPRHTITGKAADLQEAIQKLPWVTLYGLCERVYSALIQDVSFWHDGEQVVQMTLTEARGYYETELNLLLAEESIGYEFRDGSFRRPGRVQTQKAVGKAATILSAPELSEAAGHFRKATTFFSKAPEADYENAAKEAVAALEASAKSLFAEETKAKALSAILKRLEGTGKGEIPPTLVKSMDALYAFRGAATGVSHGGATGGIVSPEVAELVLSLAATYITFLADFHAAREEPPPF